MPSFINGEETWICQICAKIKTGPSHWRKDITQNQSAGNVCPSCLKIHQETGKTGNELRKEVNDYPL